MFVTLERINQLCQGEWGVWEQDSRKIIDRQYTQDYFNIIRLSMKEDPQNGPFIRTSKLIDLDKSLLILNLRKFINNKTNM